MIARLLWANGRIEERQVTAEEARRPHLWVLAYQPTALEYTAKISEIGMMCPSGQFRRKPEQPVVGVVEFEEVVG